MYGNGANEVLLSKVLEKHRDKVFLATKFGFRYKEDNLNPKNSLESYIDGSPEWIKVAVENSLRRLNTDVIDLYYAHRIDPNVPVEDTIGAMADLVKQGKVCYLGLSEASAETIRKAHKNAGAVDLHLTAADLAEIDAIIARYPNMGARYNAQQLAAVNH